MSRFYTFGALVTTALFLTGCNGLDQKVGTFAVADIQQAQDAARASNDLIALNCYATLLPLAQRFGDPAYEAHGLVMLLQKRRDFEQAKTALTNACGPIAMDLLMSMNKFGP